MPTHHLRKAWHEKSTWRNLIDIKEGSLPRPELIVPLWPLSSRREVKKETLRTAQNNTHVKVNRFRGRLSPPKNTMEWLGGS